MIIDTSKKVIKHNFYGFILTLAILIIIGILIVTKNYNERLFGIDKGLISIILIIIYILYLIYNLLHDYHYVYFSDEEDNKLIFRHFPIRIMIEKKNSIEIKKEDFVGFYVEKKLISFKEYLIIYQKLGKKIGKYPPISISFLSKKEKEQLFTTLKKYGEFKKFI